MMFLSKTSLACFNVLCLVTSRDDFFKLQSSHTRNDSHEDVMQLKENSLVLVLALHHDIIDVFGIGTRCQSSGGAS